MKSNVYLEKIKALKLKAWQYEKDCFEERSEKTLNEALELARKHNNKIEKSLIQGLIYLLNAQHDEAQQCFLEASRTRNRQVKAEVTLYLGRTCIKKSLYSLGFFYLNKAIAQNPKSALAYLEKAFVQEYLGHEENAIASLEKASQIEPDWSWPWINLSVLYYRKGLFKRSFEIILKAVSISPNSPTVLNNLGVLFVRIAKEMISESIERNPPAIVEELFLRARALFQRAINIEKKLGNKPSFIFHCNLGLMLVQEKKWAEAKETFQNASKVAKKSKKVVKEILSLYLSNHVDFERKIEENRNHEISAFTLTRRHLLKSLIDDVDNFITTKDTDRRSRSLFLAGGEKPRQNQPIMTNHLAILQRWKVGTFPLPRDLANAGGGYFLRWQNKGIVIDPGYNFLRHFESAGYNINDIHAIIITQPHIEHTRDLEPLMCLLQDLNFERTSKGLDLHKVTILLNRDSLALYGPLINQYNFIDDIYCLQVGNSRFLNQLGLRLTATHTKHSPLHFSARQGSTLSVSQNMGIVIELFENVKKKTPVITIGFVEDTGWDPDIVKAYQKCQLLVVHVGDITFREIFLPEHNSEFIEQISERMPEINEDTYKTLGFSGFHHFWRDLSRHKGEDYTWLFDERELGFTGLFELLQQTLPRLVILSELRPELAEKRLMIARALNYLFQRQSKQTKILTGDLNLKVHLPDLKVFCDIHQDFKDYAGIREICVAHEEKAMKYFCSSHSTTEVQLNLKGEFSKYNWLRIPSEIEKRIRISK